MNAIVIRQHGGLEQLDYADVPRPEVKPGWVLVRTRAAALNHLDLWVLGGLPGLNLQMPHVPGSDGAGVVEEVGEGVRSFAPGDRVMLNACVWCGSCEFCLQGEHSLCIRLKLIGEHLPGTFAECFQAPEASLLKIPEGVDFEQAAAFSLVFLTAWRMLKTQARIQAAQDVFIHGIGSGVSTACLQIAKVSGARAFVSSSSDDKLQRARRMGADFAYNYRSSDVVDQVLRQTGKRGTDIVVDSVGAETWLQSLKIVCKGGRIVTCGATTGPAPATNIPLIFWKQIRILGSTMANAREYREVVRLLGQGRLSAPIDRTFPLSEGKQALEYLHSGQQFGKIVLTIPA
ncbi:MAG: zinc-binding dehydrogenase [Acidobacteriota bacterium]